MNFRISILAAASALSGFAGNASAQDIVSDVQKGCSVEIEKYCSQVTLGEGRLLACFYAHEDKLTGQCGYTLYKASAQLEHAVSALNYVAGQCQDDIIAYCAQLQLGEGHILSCLKSNADSVSAECKAAVSEVFE
jgi:hypothetical protein